MSLRFLDSFDHYGTADLNKKWTTVTNSPTIQSGQGRNGTNSLRCGNTASVSKTLDAQPTWAVGMSFRNTLLLQDSLILQFFDAATIQCGLRLNTDGTLSVVRGTGTTVAGGTSSAGNFLVANTVYHVEMKVTIADAISAGSCVVRVNGLTWITVTTGEDLKSTANATANIIRVGSSLNLGNCDIDDVYICDGTGSANNGLLGDVMVSVLRPSGAGNSTGWTPSAGSNYQNVDETTSDGDTTYNSTATPGAVDLYALDDLAANPGAIKGLQWNAMIRKDDASSYVLNRVIRTGGVDYTGSTSIAPNTTYVNYHEIFDVNPGTSAAWTKSEVDALQAGVKLVSVV